MIKKFTPQLEYTLGQLKEVYLKNDFITPDSIKVRYDNVLWADSAQPILAYLHLLLAGELITLLTSESPKIHFTKNIIPTLGTYDFNYPHWLKVNRQQLLEHFFGSVSSDE